MFKKSKDKYQIRTDIAFEELDFKSLGKESNNEIIEEHNDDGILVRKTYVSQKAADELNKKSGIYYLIDACGCSVSCNLEKVEKCLIEVLGDILEFENISFDDKGLIVGLGNINITPDSLGPMVIDNVMVTRHLFDSGEAINGLSNVCAITPGVMGQTGLETSDVIKAIIKQKDIDYLIVIDALASRSVKRVNKTIQVTNAGISPGSGIGAVRKELSKKVLGIPVIAIGVPTVVDAITIVSDTLDRVCSFYGDDDNHPFENYNRLNSRERRILFEQILGDNNFMVTPKEIDCEIEDLSRIISNSIDKTLHQIYK